MTDIEDFLAKAKEAIRCKNRKILESRSKNMRTLAALGITFNDIWDDLLELTPNDHWKKDLDDNPEFPGFVWITKKHLHGEIIYIKLKIKKSPPGQLLVISYHIDGIE